MAEDLVLAARQLGKSIATRQRRNVETAAITKATDAVTEAVGWATGGASKSFGPQMGNTGLGGAATMLSAKANSGVPAHPGTSWSNQGGLQNALIARVTQNLASGFARAPEELELSLAEQGLSWGPPFPPGRPLDPFWGYRRPPRTWDYPVGTNVQLTPRQGRLSFQALESLWEAYDVAQIATMHLINDVRSLDYNWEPIPGIKADVSGDIEEAIAFFDSPDKRQPFRAWLAEYLEDVIKFDAGALYIRRNEAGDPIALEVVSGSSIIPLVDFFGRRPEDEADEHAEPEDLFGGEIVPAYVQIIEGLPWDWLAADDLIYQAWNPQPASQYGRAPLERVMLSANTDIRFQWHFLQYFTEGSIPAGFMEAPPDQSDPAQIAHWQEVWDAIMVGDQTKQTQVRWVPNGSKFTGTKDDANKFDKDFPLYLMRRTCAAHGVTPSDLGFTEEVNKATSETQIDVQFRVGTTPLLRHCEDVINLFVKQHLKLRCRIRFDNGQETEDRVATATADKIYTEAGVKSVDEVRQGLGLHVDKSRPMPRYINNTRSGPIPLLALESMAGEIDPDTYGPSDSQEPVSTPFAPPPGTIPPAGSPEQLAAAENTAQQARNLVEATTGEAMATDPTKPTDGEPAKPVAGEDESEEAEGGEEGGAEKERVGYRDVLALLDEIEKANGKHPITGLLQGSYGGYGCGQIWVNDAKERVLINFGDGEGDAVDPVRALAEKEWPDYEIETDAEVGFPGEGWELSPLSAAPPTKGEAVKAYDNTGGPGVSRGFSDPKLQPVSTGLASHGSPTTTFGGTDGLVVRGPVTNLLTDEDDEEDEDEAMKQTYVALALRRWRDNSRNRLRKGRAPRKFVDPHLPAVVHDEVWAKLSVAKSRVEVDAAFADVGKPSAGERPAFAKGGIVRDPQPVFLGDGSPPSYIVPHGAVKAKRPAFHHNADRIVEHYAPLIAKALGGLFSSTELDAAVAAGAKAKTPVEKSAGPPPNLRDAETYLRSCHDCCLFNHPVCVKYGDWPVRPDQTCDGWELAIDDQPVEKAKADPVKEAVVKALAGKASTAELERVLTELYGDGLLQGAHDSAHAAGGTIVASLKDVSEQAPKDYWDQWTPGFGRAAADAADGGMREMLEAAGHTIAGLEDTSIDRIGGMVSEGLSKGDSIQTVGKEIRDVVSDPGRSELIANTEYARAMTTASEQTYRELGVEEEEWMSEATACAECEENQDASPIKVGEDWPNGSVPVHPACRCSQAPHVDLGALEGG